VPVFLDVKELCDAYYEAEKEAEQWRESYPEIERLMDNGLLEDLDPNLPEVNDGSLAASLFKLPKRVIRKKMAGRAIALDSQDQWITELANIRWEKSILKKANMDATPRRKLKDAIRKAAGYGSQPIIDLFTDHGADFIVPYVQDVKIEAGKGSDRAADVIFWDVYYTKLQVKNMLEEAKEESTTDGYNKWDTETLQQIIDGDIEEDRPGNQEAQAKMDNGIKKSGIHFFIAYQRGEKAPFMMIHKSTKKVIREWENPDPTGAIPVRFLYCYQDFVNPYGIGIVKLAGGTQNVLDYMRKMDVLATQLGFRPPKQIQGDTDQVDFDSLVYAQDADWLVGNAKVERMEISNQVYQQLPARMEMYQTSLQKMIPMGDTTISATNSGDPTVGRTPQALKMQEASLSIDDEDFSENVDECWADLAKSMINNEFANMQGNDIMKLTDEERQILMNSGIEWNLDEAGNPVGNEFDIAWDDARATFDYEVDPDADKEIDDEAALDGKLRAYEMITADPNIDIYLNDSGMKLNRGELLKDIFAGLSNNDKIVEEISPEDQQQVADEQAAAEQEQMMLEAQAQGGQAPIEGEVVDPEAEQDMVNIEAVMQHYKVDEPTAQAMVAAEKQGFEQDEIIEAAQRNAGVAIA